MATFPVIVTRLMRGTSADDAGAEILGTFKKTAPAQDILNRCMQYVQSGDGIPDGVMFLKTVTVDQDVGEITATQAQAAGWVIDVDELASRASPPT